MTVEEADLFASFLQPMLNLHGDKRAQARDMINHPWLGGVVVQGEIEAQERNVSHELLSASSSLASGSILTKSASSSSSLPPPKPIGAAVPVPKVVGTQKKTGFDVLKGKAKATLGGLK